MKDLAGATIQHASSAALVVVMRGANQNLPGAITIQVADSSNGFAELRVGPKDKQRRCHHGRRH